MKRQRRAIATGSTTVLTVRALNRALLARQHLLERSDSTVPQMLEHLVGVQAQSPNPPYYGLWSRLRTFEPDDLSDLLTRRRAVRISLMRSTIHLVTARDCLRLRPLLQPVQDRFLNSASPYGRRLQGMNLSEMVKQARIIVEESPRETTEVARMLQAQWPDRDVASLNYAIRNLLPMVQVPPRGVWRKGGRPLVTTAESWLGKSLDHSGSVDDLILRYLGAFGPAGHRDFQVWSGLLGMRDRFEALRPRLEVFQDEDGKELFDLPRAPRPDESIPAPIRFLGEYDNVMLSHVNRTRVIPAEHRAAIATRNGQVPGAILVDGFVRGMWTIVKSRARATLRIRAFIHLSRRMRSVITEEGEALLQFATPGAGTREILFSTFSATIPGAELTKSS